METAGHNKRHEVMNMNVIWKKRISGKIGLFSFITVNRNRQVTVAQYLLFLPFCLQVWSPLKRKPYSLLKTCSAGEIKIICHPADSRKPNQTKLRRPQRRSKHVPCVPPTSVLLTQTPVRATWTEPHSPVATALQCTDPGLACQVPTNCSTANLTPRSHWARF